MHKPATFNAYKKVAILTEIHTPHTHTHPCNRPLSGNTRVSRYQKGKPIWILLKQETVTGNGISWAICKSALCSRQLPCQHPITQFFKGWILEVHQLSADNQYRPIDNRILCFSKQNNNKNAFNCSSHSRQ